MELWMHSGRTIIFYFLLVLIVRMLGKREIGKLGVFDLVVLLMIANIATVSIEDISIPFWYFVIIIAIIAIIQKIICFLQLKFSPLRGFFDGRMSVVVFNGKINYDEMKKNLYNIDDLIIQLRINKVDSILNVKMAILEHNGDLSVYTYDDTSLIPLPAIIDGKIIEKNLYYLDKSKEEILNMVKRKKANLKEINCAFLDQNDLVIIKGYKEFSKEDKRRKNKK